MTYNYKKTPISLRLSFVPRRSQVRGNWTGVKTLFWHHTSRDMSRSQETFETVSTLIIASSAGSGQEHETHLWQILFCPSPQSNQRESDRSQNAVLAVSSLAAVTPVGICLGARRHLRLLGQLDLDREQETRLFFVPRGSQVGGNQTGVGRYFGRVFVPRRSQIRGNWTGIGTQFWQSRSSRYSHHQGFVQG
ncbi:uncharacterized protein LOC128264265 isoform X2 [Drosophila gunungcola]|uniref:uncharacterized protein LOC128264265 isoform X2 n=1 Tax=Drosophila gunungcola TaxID=103775 RepID=UPI0022E70B6F|nr:uncharacterized protein LOC128264265 isoform X2 [Drosophila gunungcola]